jgi:hypothetical protein
MADAYGRPEGRRNVLGPHGRPEGRRHVRVGATYWAAPRTGRRHVLRLQVACERRSAPRRRSRAAACRSVICLRLPKRVSGRTHPAAIIKIARCGETSWTAPMSDWSAAELSASRSGCLMVTICMCCSARTLSEQGDGQVSAMCIIRLQVFPMAGVRGRWRAFCSLTRGSRLLSVHVLDERERALDMRRKA